MARKIFLNWICSTSTLNFFFLSFTSCDGTHFYHNDNNNNNKIRRKNPYKKNTLSPKWAKFGTFHNNDYITIIIVSSIKVCWKAKRMLRFWCLMPDIKSIESFDFVYKRKGSFFKHIQNTYNNLQHALPSNKYVCFASKCLTWNSNWNQLHISNIENRERIRICAANGRL